MLERLKGMEERYEVLGEARGKGLMIGLELVAEEKAPDAGAAMAFLERCREDGVLVGRGGLYGNVVRICPPLSITVDEAERALEAFDRALATLS